MAAQNDEKLIGQGLEEAYRRGFCAGFEAGHISASGYDAEASEIEVDESWEMAESQDWYEYWMAKLQVK